MSNKDKEVARCKMQAKKQNARKDARNKFQSAGRKQDKNNRTNQFSLPVGGNTVMSNE